MLLVPATTATTAVTSAPARAEVTADVDVPALLRSLEACAAPTRTLQRLREHGGLDQLRLDLASGVAGVDGCRIGYTEKPGEDAHQEAYAARSSGRSGSTGSARGRVPSARTVSTLSSRPGAPLTIFLDIDGADLRGTPFADAGRRAGPVDYDGRPGKMSRLERRIVWEAWQVVASLYAPYRVNVTTKEPSRARLVRSSADDRRYGTRVVITTDHPQEKRCGCAGQAYLGAFDDPSADQLRYRTAMVFGGYLASRLPEDGSRIGKSLGTSAAHEVGHQVGLVHDGQRRRAGSVDGYYDGNDVWAPVMGGVDYQPLAQFDDGSYPRATSDQDDLAVIASVLGQVRDDHPGRARKGDRIRLGRAVGGVLGGHDRDAFTLRLGRTTKVRLNAWPVGRFSPLDLSLRLTDRRGRTLRRVNPATRKADATRAVGTGAGTTLRLRRGTYRIVLAGGPAKARGGRVLADAYGSDGRYRFVARRAR